MNFGDYVDGPVGPSQMPLPGAPGMAPPAPPMLGAQGPRMRSTGRDGGHAPMGGAPMGPPPGPMGPGFAPGPAMGAGGAPYQMGAPFDDPALFGAYQDTVNQSRGMFAPPPDPGMGMGMPPPGMGAGPPPGMGIAMGAMGGMPPPPGMDPMAMGMNPMMMPPPMPPQPPILPPDFGIDAVNTLGALAERFPKAVMTMKRLGLDTAPERAVNPAPTMPTMPAPAAQPPAPMLPQAAMQPGAPPTVNRSLMPPY